MAIRVTMVTEERRGKPTLNAADLVERAAYAARDYLSDSLVNGYRPADGAARPRKADGKPLGFDSGLLANSLRVTVTGAGRKRATARITSSPSRDEFVAKHDDILTFDGIVSDEMNRAVDDYLEELDQ